MAKKITSQQFLMGTQMALNTLAIGTGVISIVHQIRVGKREIKEMERQIAEQKRLETEYEAELNDFRSFKKAYEEVMEKEAKEQGAIK